MKHIKIVATVGPVSLTADCLLRLADAGMSIARLNGSHADIQWHRKAIGLIREILPLCPILLDIPGRKIRTLDLEHEPHFQEGENIILTTEEGNQNPRKYPVNYNNLHLDVQPGNTIYADDGTLSFEVLKVIGKDIICKSLVSGQL